MKNIFRYLLVLLMVIALSIPVFSQWIHTSGPYGTKVCGLVSIGSNLFAGTKPYGMYISTNNGADWANRNTGLTDRDVASLVTNGSDLLAGTNNGVYLSTNSGTSWAQIGLTGKIVSSLAISGSNIFAGTYGDLVYLSTDYGTSWTQKGMMGDDHILSLAVSGTNIFAGTLFNGVFLSTNNGADWKPVNTGMTSGLIMCLAVSGSNLFAGTGNGDVFLSTDNGASWNSKLTTSAYVSSIVAYGSNIFAGTGIGVFVSKDNGSNWSAVSEDLTDPDQCSLAILGSNLFAGTYSTGVWRRPLSEMTTSVESAGNEQPLKYGLEQNYPNPFNPSTTISYSLPKASHVSLKIYNIIGKEISTILDKEMSAGKHSINFNASGLASGMYIYKLRTENFTQSKIMTLLK